jgi:hypothetical protein
VCQPARCTARYSPELRRHLISVTPERLLADDQRKSTARAWDRTRAPVRLPDGVCKIFPLPFDSAGESFTLAPVSCRRLVTLGRKMPATIDANTVDCWIHKSLAALNSLRPSMLFLALSRASVFLSFSRDRFISIAQRAAGRAGLREGNISRGHNRKRAEQRGCHWAGEYFQRASPGRSVTSRHCSGQLHSRRPPQRFGRTCLACCTR